jgi:hypothetical protein
MNEVFSREKKIQNNFVPFLQLQKYVYSRLQKNRVHHTHQEHWIFLILTHVNQAFLTFNGMLFQIGYVWHK